MTALKMISALERIGASHRNFTPEQRQQLMSEARMFDGALPDPMQLLAILSLVVPALSTSVAAMGAEHCPQEGSGCDTCFPAKRCLDALLGVLVYAEALASAKAARTTEAH